MAVCYFWGGFTKYVLARVDLEVDVEEEVVVEEDEFVPNKYFHHVVLLLLLLLRLLLPLHPILIRAIYHFRTTCLR